MKKTILILFALFAFTAMADSAFTTMPDTIITSINDHTDSIVQAVSDSATVVINNTTNKAGGIWWKILSGVLVGAGIMLRIIPGNRTLLNGIADLLLALDKKIPNNTGKTKD